MLNTHPEIGDRRERSLQIAHELVDNVKVREVGWNRGYWVEKFLASVGLGKGYAAGSIRYNEMAPARW